jgi:hypothetical protein
MNYFPNVQSFAGLKKHYRVLALAHHPDRGGDTAVTQEINLQFERLNRLVARHPELVAIDTVQFRKVWPLPEKLALMAIPADRFYDELAAKHTVTVTDSTTRISIAGRGRRCHPRPRRLPVALHRHRCQRHACRRPDTAHRLRPPRKHRHRRTDAVTRRRPRSGLPMPPDFRVKVRRLFV